MGSLMSSLLFQPPSPSTYNETSQIIWLETSREQRICAYYMDRGAKLTILFSHGNAEDIGSAKYQLRELSRHLKVNVMAYDYTGYGLNTAEPSEEDCYCDIQAAYDYLRNSLKIPSQEIILYGRSLGSGVSCHLAASESQAGNVIGGLILQSPLLSTFRVAFNFRFSVWGDKFCNIDKIQHVKAPVFVIHGFFDEIIPFYHGQELYLKILPDWKYNPYWVEGAGHNCVEHVGGSTFYSKLQDFLAFAQGRHNANLENNGNQEQIDLS